MAETPSPNPAPVAAQAFSPLPQAPVGPLTPADRSHAEIQRMLRAEIDTLCRVLDERFTEIASLSRRLAEMESETARDLQQRLDAQDKRHKLQVVLLHALYASWNRGPASGVQSFDQQTATLQQSDLFDAAWYAASYPDVSSSGLTPHEHYVRSGGFEGRNPGPGFDTMGYYLANPDVADAGWPALVHYAAFGRAEGRRIG